MTPEWWLAVVAWTETWNESQGFWTAIQGIATAIAAIAALIALIIAARQLGQLIRSNRLLAASNDAMTHSNVALTRPYIVVDFQYRPFMNRSGEVRSITVTVHVENAGRTPAKNLRLLAEPPFPVPIDPEHPGWQKGVEELNRVMNGTTVIKSLTSLRPLTYYLAKADDIMGAGDQPDREWTITATYEDAEGRAFTETSVLELSHWRQAMVTVDPLYRIAKSVQTVAYEVKSKKLPSLDIDFPPAPRARIGRPRTRRVIRGRTT